MPYSEVSITGYNANPPEDDGTEASSNEVSWAKHKTKIGDPLKTAIEATQTAISTIIDELETAIAALNVAGLAAPAGTIMLFGNATAPTGWTKGSSHDNKALRLVTGTPSTGGSTAFTSVLTSRTIATVNLPSHTHSFSATTSSDGAHTHTYNRPQTPSNQGGAGSQARVTSVDTDDDTGSAGSHTHSVSGTTGGTGSGTAMDFDVQYVDVILATKDE